MSGYSGAEVIISDLIRRIDKLEKSVGELQARYWELHRRVFLEIPFANGVRESNAAENESRDYKKR